MKPLLNHIFLITRPEQQAKQLCAKLAQLGGCCIVLPTITIHPFPIAEIQQAITQLPTRIDKIIFTSANAVYPVMPYWSQIKPAMTFAIGSGTAKVLADFHIHATTPQLGQFNSEGLLAMPEMQTVADQHIIIFAGAGGRQLLADELVKRGANVQKIAVYERKMPASKATFPVRQDVSLIISTSSESLTNLWQMAGPAEQDWLSLQQLLVINTAMQTLARKLGFKRQPLLAQNASDAAIIAAIIAWCGN